MAEARPVALVTGASRGAGAGIAQALGEAGYHVWLTGRTLVEGGNPLPGSLPGVVAAIERAGGSATAAALDHRDDAAVEALSRRIEGESGRLDVLVNNVAAIHDELIMPGGFWERPMHLVDILDVGLRSHYVTSWHLAPLLIRTGGGLIAFTSSFGSVCYMHGPAYGAQKAGIDKFAADMGVDLKTHDVAAVSIWMGPLITERSSKSLAERPDQYEGFMAQAETPAFTGRLIAAIHRDPERMALSGQTLIGAEIASRYGVTEAGGREPPSYREMLGEPRIPHPAIVR